MKKYNKLVRDKIPAIIEKEGRTCVTKTVSDNETLVMLAEKLKEEADEFLKDPSPHELADILEVAYAMADKAGWKLEDVEKVRQKKRLKNGGFEKNIFLVEAE